MKFFCDQCNAQYMIADEKVGPRGVKVKCKKCAHVIVVKAAESQEALPSPQPSSSVSDDETRIHSTNALHQSIGTERKTSGESPIAQAMPESAASAGDSAADLSAPVGGASAAPSLGSAKDWFVAVGDTQLGPLDVAEVHGRWDAGELHEDSLAWRSGMPDWIALSEIPEFTDWVTQRPRTAPDKAEAAAKKGEGLGLAPASGVAWKPSAASALSSLMQEELLAAAAPKPKAAHDTPAGMPELGNVARLGAGDLFGAAPDAPNVAPRAPREEGGGGAAWSVPAPRKQGMGAAGWALVGGGVLSMMGAGVFMARNRAPDITMASAQTPNAAQPAGQAPAQVMTSTPQPQPLAQPPGQPPTPSAPAGAGSNATGTPSTDSPREHLAAAPATPAPSAGRPMPSSDVPAAVRGKKSHDIRDAHEPRAPRTKEASVAQAPAAPAAAVKASLGKEDIWGVVRQSASKVAPCIKNARSRNEIPAGKYTFVLDWTIRPDGAVTDAHLKGPPEVLSTSLASCFAAAMITWRFPASQAGAPIANFPFGPVNVP